MKTLRKILICIPLFGLVSTLQVSAQINVFEENCLELSQSVFDNTSGDIQGTCIETPDDGNIHEFSPSSDKDVKAASFIRFKPGTNIKSDNARTHAYIEESPFEVVAFVDDLNGVPKLGKFELGIKLPTGIQERINNFLNDSGTNQLNPFLSNEVHIYTEFEYIGGNPLANAWTEVNRDGFYYDEVERDISGFEDLYNHSSANTEDGVGDEEYKTLGGSWTVTKSEFPFRVRFAPEHIGEWRARVIVDINNGSEVLESPDFTFKVIDSNNEDYIVVGNTSRYLKREGKTYIPTGMNFPFISRTGFPLRNPENDFKIINDPQYYSITAPVGLYEQGLRYLDTLAMNGVNHIRMIMAPWSAEIEWEKLGDYSNRQEMAKEMDLMLEKAEEHNIAINWNLSMHTRFSENLFSNKYWDWEVGNAPNSEADVGCPYNRELGLNDIEDFFTDANAKFYWKQRLRYIVARWGYSPQIAMFELLSEIDQVGRRLSEELTEITPASYGANPAVYADWQIEMAKYLKEKLNIRQLLTSSYTSGGIDDVLDKTYQSDYLDVASVNNYNYETSNIHGFHKDDIGFLVAHEGFNIKPTTFASFHWLEKYYKPIFFSESGAHETWGCDNGVETRRNIWQNAFWGVAGTLDWDHEVLDPKIRNWDIYERVSEFFDGVDLDLRNWHSGMTRLQIDGTTLQFRSSYRNDAIRDDELADVVYLRSNNKEKAFGVITNRRANYHTLGDDTCHLAIPPPEHSDFDPQEEDEYADYTELLQTYGPVTADDSLNTDLRIRNMSGGFLGIPKEYKIKYYSPYDQVNSIKEETRWSPILKLDFPDLDTLDIVLFEVFPMGENFKSMSNDSTDTEDIPSRKPKKEKKEGVKVYPNPNDGNFVVYIEKPSEVKTINVYDNLGKQVDSRHDVFRENHYNKINFRAGVYSVEVVFESEILRKKVVVH